MIANDIETQLDSLNSKLTTDELAEIVGVTDSTIRRILKGEIETSFYNLYKIHDYLNTSYDKFLNWIYKLELPNNMKAAMEYLSINKKLDDLKKYIHDCVQQHTNKSLKKWVKVYLLVIEYEENPYKHFEILKKLREVQYTDKEVETSVLLRLLEGNINYRIVSSNAAYLHEMTRICKEVKEDLPNVKDDFLLLTFSLRLHDLLGKSSLYVDADPEKARNYSFENIEQKICPLFKANALYTIGASFIFESYDESIKYTKESIKAYRESDYSHFADDLEKSAIPLINAHYGVKVDDGDLSEVAHYEAKWGDKQKAKGILNTLIAENGESMYKLYYLGLAEESDEKLFKSLTQFLQIGDNFFAQFPLNQLKRSANLQTGIMAEIMYNQFTK